jgi:hypothetical protein
MRGSISKKLWTCCSIGPTFRVALGEQAKESFATYPPQAPITAADLLNDVCLAFFHLEPIGRAGN